MDLRPDKKEGKKNFFLMTILKMEFFQTWMNMIIKL